MKKHTLILSCSLLVWATSAFGINMTPPAYSGISSDVNQPTNWMLPPTTGVVNSGNPAANMVAPIGGISPQGQPLGQVVAGPNQMAGVSNQTAGPVNQTTAAPVPVPVDWAAAPVLPNSGQWDDNTFSAVAHAIADHLVTANPLGKVADKTAFSKAGIPTGAYVPRHFLFYFSAHWCPPCRIFTPQFVDFYNNNLTPEQQGHLMVIFVSKDDSEQEMWQYMVETKMPWTAIAFADRNSIPKVNELVGPGIPCLVMVDKNFNVEVDSYNNGSYTPPLQTLRDVQQKLLF